MCMKVCPFPLSSETHMTCNLSKINSICYASETETQTHGCIQLYIFPLQHSILWNHKSTADLFPEPNKQMKAVFLLLLFLFFFQKIFCSFPDINRCIVEPSWTWICPFWAEVELSSPVRKGPIVAVLRLQNSLPRAKGTWGARRKSGNLTSNPGISCWLEAVCASC